MKFHAKGPNIPDHLLWSRDKGKVVFICGAGISKAKAELPDFPELVGKVLDELNVVDDHKARQVLKLAMKPKNKGLVPLDKVFSELERNYDTSEIEEAVSKILTPQESVDTYCHKVIRDLATTPNEGIRLVTTNFDDLFSRVTDVDEWVGPDLPRFDRSTLFSGLVYLHGKCPKPVDSKGDSFILSTSSFGRAYMAEGWASNFLKHILEHYTVVFIGYSADDPPMQYLLEALARIDKNKKNVYAFHRGSQHSANEKWEHRGVCPIAFDDYKNLWTTLGLWRERALEPNQWIKNKLDMADAGPFDLADWERSQIAHIASHQIGAKEIADRDKPIPPSWLFCFDSAFRYVTPMRPIDSRDETEYPDPFSVLGLTDDPTPDPISLDDYRTRREAPKGVWDAFLPLEDEQTSLKINLYSGNITPLPIRIEKLAEWISKVMDLPLTIRWASQKKNFHPALKRLILHKIAINDRNLPLIVEEAWEIIFESMDQLDIDMGEIYHLQEKIRHSGWSHTRVRKYKEITRPKITLEDFMIFNKIFADSEIPKELKNLISMKVEFSEHRIECDIPDIWLEHILEVDRVNLEAAADLEKQTGQYWIQLPPIIELNDEDILEHNMIYGIDRLAFNYLYNFKKLVKIDKNKALSELAKWPENDADVFGRFKIWAAGEVQLFSSKESADVILKLPQETFWGDYHQRDLLNTLKFRWNSLPLNKRKRIEQRIIGGDDAWHEEELARYTQRKAEQSATMLQWLNNNQCGLELDFEAAIADFQKLSPSWSPDWALVVDRQLESRVRTIQLNINYDVLLKVDAEGVIDVARENMDRNRGSLEEVDPFRGYCNDFPEKAFEALLHKAKKGEFPEWAWSTWLSRESEECWSEYLLVATSQFIISASDHELEQIKSRVFYWFKKVSGDYTDHHIDTRDKVFDRLLSLLKSKPGVGCSVLIRRQHKDIDWSGEMLNSPIGDLADSLLSMQEVNKLSNGDQIPQKWLIRADTMLSLEGDNGRYVLACFMRQILWFSYWLPDWTDEKLLIFEKSDDSLTVDAYWSGLFYGLRKRPSLNLFRKIKNGLLKKCSDPLSLNDAQARNLISIILLCWLSRDEKAGKRWVTDTEFREIMAETSDEMRCHVLWRLSRWVRDDQGSSDFDQMAELEQFFSTIWPRTMAAKTSSASERLLELALINTDYLPKLAPLIVSCLVKLEWSSIKFSNSHLVNKDILDKHPKIIFEMLYKTLPDDTNNWLGGIGKIIETIEENAPELKSDRQFMELKHRWESR